MTSGNSGTTDSPARSGGLSGVQGSPDQSLCWLTETATDSPARGDGLSSVQGLNPTERADPLFEMGENGGLSGLGWRTVHSAKGAGDKVLVGSVGKKQ